METDTIFNEENEPKQRHGCVTAWLILLIVTNSLTAALYFFGRDLVVKSLHKPDASGWLVAMGVCAIANVAFAVLLFKWKKAGFYGYLGTSIIALLINIQLGLGIGQSLIGLLGIVILFAILQIKEGDVKAWDNLE